METTKLTRKKVNRMRVRAILRGVSSTMDLTGRYELVLPPKPRKRGVARHWITVGRYFDRALAEFKERLFR